LKIVFLSQADILHDYEKINRNIKDAFHGMVSFAVSPHPHISARNHFVNKSLYSFGDALDLTRFCGVVAINKQQYSSCVLTTKDSSNFDTQLKLSFEKKGYAHKFVLSEI